MPVEWHYNLGLREATGFVRPEVGEQDGITMASISGFYLKLAGG